MLAIQSYVRQQDWAYLLPSAKFSYSIAYSATVHGTPSFLMFGREGPLLVDEILGLSQLGVDVDIQDFAVRTQEGLQLAFWIGRRLFVGRSYEQARQHWTLKR